jgi:hypothetical protein
MDAVADVLLDEAGPLAPRPALPTRKTVLQAIAYHAIGQATTVTGKRLAAIARSDDPPVLPACAAYLSARTVSRAARDVTRCLRFNALPCRSNRPYLYPPGPPVCVHCRNRFFDNARHAFGACVQREIKITQRLYHNHAVELIATAVRRQARGRFKLLYNTAGRGSVHTVPGNLVPGYGGCPDFLQLQGWGAPASRLGPRRPDVRLLWVELAFSDDANLVRKRHEKTLKYTPDFPLPDGAMNTRHLLDEARERGYQALGVSLYGPPAPPTLDGRHIAVIALGHSGVVTESTHSWPSRLWVSPVSMPSSLRESSASLLRTARPRDLGGAPPP